MGNEGEQSVGASTVQAVEDFLKESRKKPMVERNVGEKSPVENFRLDPNVNPGVILYPTPVQIQDRLDQLHNLKKRSNNDIQISQSGIGFLEKLKIGFSPSTVIDRASKARADGFSDGQTYILEEFLGATGQPWQMNAGFGPDNVAELLDEYGFILRLATLGRVQHAELGYSSGLNPALRIKQIQELPAAEYKEWAKGRVLGQLSMLHDILGSLGQTAQMVQIERNTEREAAHPAEFRRNVNRKQNAGIEKAFADMASTANDLAKGPDILDVALDSLSPEQEALAKTITPEVATKMIADAQQKKGAKDFQKVSSDLRIAISVLTQCPNTESIRATAYEVFGDITLKAKLPPVASENLYRRAINLLTQINDSNLTKEPIERITKKMKALGIKKGIAI